MRSLHKSEPLLLTCHDAYCLVERDRNARPVLLCGAALVKSYHAAVAELKALVACTHGPHRAARRLLKCAYQHGGGLVAHCGLWVAYGDHSFQKRPYK